MVSWVLTGYDGIGGSLGRSIFKWIENVSGSSCCELYRTGFHSVKWMKGLP